MLFKRFYDENLAQASYMIACEKTREAIIVDPNTDVGRYTRAAGADRVRIAHVTETHIHADYVSGAAALAKAAGATLHLSAEGASEWGYTEAALGSAHALNEGSVIEVGRVRLRALHTPGHTPEHLSFLAYDLERGEEAVGALTGDFVFVGDVGRPDLLERAAGAAGSMERSARDLYRSVRRFSELPDYLQVWPGHGAGSACGKSLGSMPQSTLGYEKLFNWAFAGMSESEFVARVLEDQPVPPRYFAQMKKVNREAGIPQAPPPLRFLTLEDLESLLKKKATIVDTRSAQKFASGHVPGTFSIPLGKSFLNWSGALVPANADLYLVSDRDGEEAVTETLGELCKIGLTRVRGVFPGEVVREWKTKNGELERVVETDPVALKTDGKNNVQIVDVRNPDEWSKGHLPSAHHIPLAALPDRLHELDRNAPIVLQCQSGERSAIATSFLQSRGISKVSNLAGGLQAWVAEGFEVESERPTARDRERGEN